MHPESSNPASAPPDVPRPDEPVAGDSGQALDEMQSLADAARRAGAWTSED